MHQLVRVLIIQTDSVNQGWRLLILGQQQVFSQNLHRQVGTGLVLDFWTLLHHLYFSFNFSTINERIFGHLEIPYHKNGWHDSIWTHSGWATVWLKSASCNRAGPTLPAPSWLGLGAALFFVSGHSLLRRASDSHAVMSCYILNMSSF